MGLIGAAMAGLRAGLVTFRREYFASGDPVSGGSTYDSRDARMLRYALLWALYEGTAYDATHRFAAGFRHQLGLYRDTRAILAPAYRLGEFWAIHLLGGRLDPEAGDGSGEPSALPVLGADDALRGAIARLWADSNWETAKSVWCRHGAVMGDCYLIADDDPGRGKVRLRPVHPAAIAELTLDDYGHVKGYVLEESRDDPADPRRALAEAGRPRRQVLYTEEVTRDGANVVYRTYRDHRPYPWNGTAFEWSIPYGFVPLWQVQHTDTGGDFGVGEFQPALRRGAELDDQASKLNDQVRKTVEAIWVFSGVRKGDATGLSLKQEDRDELPALYLSDPAARAEALVASLDLAAASAHIAWMFDQAIQDYPELTYDRVRSSGNTSAEALREAKKPAEAKVEERRARYDAALVRAIQGALAIGGWRGYPGYDGLGLESYAAGRLDLRIGPRPVFAVTGLDLAEEDTARAQQAAAWIDAGLPEELAWRRAGLSEDDVAEALRLREEAEAAQPSPPVVVPGDAGQLVAMPTPPEGEPEPEPEDDDAADE